MVNRTSRKRFLGAAMIAVTLAAVGATAANADPYYSYGYSYADGPACADRVSGAAIGAAAGAVVGSRYAGRRGIERGAAIGAAVGAREAYRAGCYYGRDARVATTYRYVAPVRAAEYGDRYGGWNSRDRAYRVYDGPYYDPCDCE